MSTITPIEQLEMLLTESQSNLRDTIAVCRQLLNEKQQLIDWQLDAVQTLARWHRCVELIPSVRLVHGAREADCVYAYIDHLHEQLIDARAENRRLVRALQSFGENHAATEERQG